MSTQEYIRSFTETIPDEFPTLTPLPETSSASNVSYLSSISWQTWVIIILILALLGINIFAYLAKGTQFAASIFEQVFLPILKLLGYSTLETTKQTVETSATGTKAGVDIVAGATTGAINTIQQNDSMPSQGTNQVPQGQSATSSLPVQNNIQQDGGASWQQDSLEKALSSASQSSNEGPQPNDSSSSLQITGKSGWCFIGDDQGVRACSEIGVNDTCMSGDVFPNQAICMNPNLRA